MNQTIILELFTLFVNIHGYCIVLLLYIKVFIIYHIARYKIIVFIAGFTVMFNASSYSGAEADGVIAVTVVATGVLPFPYNVTMTPSEHVPTSASGLSDYSNDTIVVTFNPEETEKTALVPVNPDCILEGPEFFNLTLSAGPAVAAFGVMLGNSSVAVAEIEDTESKQSFTI